MPLPVPLIEGEKGGGIPSLLILCGFVSLCDYSLFIINSRLLSAGVDFLGQFVEATSLIPELTHFYELFPHLLRITVWRTNGYNAGMFSTAKRTTTESGLGVKPR